ncbi:aminotransferase class III-fold pyridoxal phosphate-dependent enzyme [Enterococcus faecalis]
MKKRGRKFFWHPMTDTKIGDENTVVVERGEGNYVYDDQGNRLLDGVAGLWCMNVGHNRTEINEAIKEQLDTLAYYQLFSNVGHPKAYELAERIISMTKEENMAKVFFTSGGSDSVDTSLKIARQYWAAVGQPSKKMFISLERSYHGMHYGGTSIGGNESYQKHVGPGLEGCIHVSSPHLKENKWGCRKGEELTQRCIDELIEIIESNGEQNIAALIAEPVQGAGGIIVPPEDYWLNLREVCDKYNILLISDEVVTGFGRSGNMFGCRGWGVKPDMMIFAKGLTSGYVPLGATVFNKKIVDAIESASGDLSVITHGHTYGGHPLGCVAAIEALKIVEEERLVENANHVGGYLLEKLSKLKEQYDCISDVRGKGLMLAIDFEDEKNYSADQSIRNVEIIADYTTKSGVLIRDELQTIIISPPLTISKEEADTLVVALTEAFEYLNYECN